MKRSELGSQWWYRLCKVVYVSVFSLVTLVTVMAIWDSITCEGEFCPSLDSNVTNILLAIILIPLVFWGIQWIFHYIVIGRE